jgi:hypothetical protein
MNFTSKLLSIVLGVVLMMTVGAAAFADDEESAPGGGIPQAIAIESTASDALSVLDDPQVPSDGMPVEIAAALDERAGFGMNPDLSRRSIGGVPYSLYVIPANGYVCSSLTDSQGATTSCAATDDVASGQTGPATQSLDDATIGVFGVVPDGVEQVMIRTGQANEDVVPVENNAYFVAYSAGTVMHGLSYVGPSGEVEYPLVDPADAF